MMDYWMKIEECFIIISRHCGVDHEKETETEKEHEHEHEKENEVDSKFEFPDTHGICQNHRTICIRRGIT
jgi:hypothetical protein